ncbi:MAG: hypothetical protein EOP86_13300 [Verrucomicrobiaceae bacterium]|nr:MAG: hypothetical protein EOP86_13300 [Verrucomicrobiaceae bacterium]
MGHKASVERVDEILAAKLLADHGRYVRLMDAANISRMNFYLGGAWLTTDWRVMGRQLLYLAALQIIGCSFAVKFAGVSWMGGLIMTVMFMEIMRLHHRTDALADLREGFLNGSPLTGGRNAVSAPAKPVADISTLPG